MIKSITLYTKPISINQKYGVVNGRNILQKKYRDTKADLALETRSQWNTEPLTGDVTMNILFYYGDKSRRDIDAYIKILLDSMEGIVFENDVQITEMHIYKSYDKQNPRTEVSIL